jgi:hypothetical protein
MKRLSETYGAASLFIAVAVALLFALVALQEHRKAQDFGLALPAAPAVFETSLQDRITESDTSLTLVSTSTASGEAIPTGYHCFTLDEGRSDAEFVCGTLGGDRAVTSLERGVSFITGTSTVTANKHDHRKGANVKVTDFPVIQRMRAQLSGSDTIPNLLSYANTVLIGVGSALERRRRGRCWPSHQRVPTTSTPSFP